MRCEDIRELADSFLKGELLVETNHEVVRHMETCEKCRAALEAHQEFRERLRKAVKQAPDARIDAAFAARLRSDLRKTAGEPNARTLFHRGAFPLKSLTASFAALLLVALAAVFVYRSENTNEEIVSRPAADQTSLPPNENQAAMWQKIGYQAIGDHQHCGLDKMTYWQKNAAVDSAQKADFRERILNKTDFGSSERMRLLHVHDCVYDGRVFTHAVIEFGDRTVSVLLTETEFASAANINNREKDPNAAIICRKQTGFQVASFVGLNKAVFVISDLPEAENLNLARSLSNVMNS